METIVHRKLFMVEFPVLDWGRCLGLGGFSKAFKQMQNLGEVSGLVAGCVAGPLASVDKADLKRLPGRIHSTRIKTKGFG